MRPGFSKLRAQWTYMGHRMEKTRNIHRCMEYLNALNWKKASPLGDYCEFGVYDGFLMTSAYHVSAMYKYLAGMRFFGFDSFQGLPETKDTYDKHPHWQKGDYSCTLARAADNFKKAKVPSDRYRLIPGWFDETLNGDMARKYGIQKIAYAHIDCDLYSSAKAALDFVKPYLIPGAVIDFDDYLAHPTPLGGESMALKEWLGKNTGISIREFNRYGAHGAAFTVYFEDKHEAHK